MAIIQLSIPTVMSLILHIPHSSTEIPEKALGDYSIHKDELESITAYLSDLRTDELFDLRLRKTTIRFPWARTYVDVERFLDRESMERLGMGAFYTQTPSGKLMREIDGSMREGLEKLYWQHQNNVLRVCRRALDRHGHFLLIDCHSFPKEPFPWEDKSRPRPEFCIGHNGDYLGQEVAQSLKEDFVSYGHACRTNTPFSHSYVPHALLDEIGSEDWTSVMIEVRRDLVEKRFEETKKVLEKVLRPVAKEFRDVRNQPIVLGEGEDYNTTQTIGERQRLHSQGE